MTIDDIMISRFFKNLCTEEEALAVAKYLAVHPEKLEEVLPQELWDHMDELSFLSATKKDELFEAIHAQTEIKQRRPVLLWSLSIAASLLMVLGAGWWMWNGNYATQPQTKTESKAADHYTLVKINYGKEDMKLEIADGSVIYLKPNGEIRYPELLDKQKRDFHLKGAARFKVAEDEKRPFNVYAGGTVTTALGTDFTISSEEDHNHVSVLLHSGKVVVSADSCVQHAGMKKTYLLPGNKLLINKTNFSLALIKNAEEHAIRQDVIVQKGQTEFTATEISFRNQSLDKIFSVLKSDFAVHIQFEKVPFKGMYFTGSIKRNAQTVEPFLNEIALLNHLNIERRDSTYILKPQARK